MTVRKKQYERPATMGSSRRGSPSKPPRSVIGAGVLIRSLLAQAVADEIASWQPNWTDRVDLDPGTIRRDSGARFRYEFPWKNRSIQPVLRKGRIVALHLEGRPPVSAWVCGVGSKHIILDLDEELPSPTPAGHLIDDPRWISRALRRRLLSPDCRVGERLALEMVGYPIGPPKLPPVDLVAPTDLNRGQQLAVKRAGEPGSLFVEGPPGTGKTTTVAAMAEALIHAGLSVLVVAPSNQATDEVATSICDRLQHDPRFGDGLVLRLGSLRSRALRQRYGRAVSPDNVVLGRLGPAADPDPALIRAMRDRVVRSCPLIVTTAHRAYLSRTLHRLRDGFDVVILDEASMMPLPLAYEVATLARRSVIVAGDFHQLPAVSRVKDSNLYQSNPFTARGIPTRNRKITGGARIHTLGVQYRMDPPISTLLNRLVYGNLLSVAPSVMSRGPIESGIGTASLVLIDTKRLSAKKAGQKGLANPTHARVIATWLQRVAVKPADGGPPEVAVLSRFREQVRAILGALPPRTGRPGVIVNTVHALQGGEVDTVIFDLAMTRDSFPGDYVVDQHPTDEGGQVLTVGLSRARRRVVIVADTRLVLHDGRIPQQAMSRRLIRFFQENGHVIVL